MIKLYTLEGCLECAQARLLLNGLRIEYNVIEIAPTEPDPNQATFGSTLTDRLTPSKFYTTTISQVAKLFPGKLLLPITQFPNGKVTSGYQQLLDALTEFQLCK